MKKGMTDYINAMANNNLETLEQIISTQYRKFVRFYNLVASYTDIIKDIKYDYKSSKSLDIRLSFKNNDLEHIKDSFVECMSEHGYDGTVELGKKYIDISILLEEETT